MSDQERPEEKKFKVTDRRLFTEEGERRQQTAPQEAGSANQERGSEDVRGATLGRDPGKGTETSAEIDFSSFVLSMAGSAMMHLGEGPPGSPENALNLPAARQMIEILRMLQEKTKGNLSTEEAQLLQQVLFELQMTFVKKKQQ